MKRGMWNPCFTGSLLEQNVVSFQMSQEAVLGSVLFMILLLPENHTLFVPLGKCPRNDDYFIDMDILDLNIIANCPNSLLHFAWAFVSHVSKPSCRLSVLVVWETAGSTILMFSCSVEGAEARSFEGTCPKPYNKFKYIRSGFRLLILSSYDWSPTWSVHNERNHTIERKGKFLFGKKVSLFQIRLALNFGRNWSNKQLYLRLLIIANAFGDSITVKFILTFRDCYQVVRR